jgi:methyl coenzyme M reductase subunit D
LEILKIKVVKIMGEITTEELTNELYGREGISRLLVKPHSEVTITTGDNTTVLTGPAVIIINQD